ncbi:MAG: hypothetical protein CM1200mP30_20510 [Pseudomonadota bacterium]|nr:MAG: hypothetical protein CM1200mP30_20510 [Pseudomonadota bacterium]
MNGFPRLNRFHKNFSRVSALVLILSFFVKGEGSEEHGQPILHSHQYLNSIYRLGCISMDTGSSSGIRFFSLGGINFVKTRNECPCSGNENDGYSIAVWFIVIAVILFRALVGPLMREQ